MLSQVELARLPSYSLGQEQGIQQGETAVLETQLARRFGPLSAETQKRLKNATPEQLEHRAAITSEARQSRRYPCLRVNCRQEPWGS